MRTIQFRAWDKTNQKMCDEKDFMMSLDSDVLDPSTFPFTVRKDVLLLQYTGLKDKNGKEIYFEDYVEHENIVYLVKWNIDRVSLLNISNGDIIKMNSGLIIKSNLYENTNSYAPKHTEIS